MTKQMQQMRDETIDSIRDALKETGHELGRKTEELKDPIFLRGYRSAYRILKGNEAIPVLVTFEHQDQQGTAEQKVPYHVICLAEAIRNKLADRVYLVLGGQNSAWKHLRGDASGRSSKVHTKFKSSTFRNSPISPRTTSSDPGSIGCPSPLGR